MMGSTIAVTPIATHRSHVNGLKNAHPCSMVGVLCVKMATDPE